MKKLVYKTFENAGPKKSKDLNTLFAVRIYEIESYSNNSKQ